MDLLGYKESNYQSRDSNLLFTLCFGIVYVLPPRKVGVTNIIGAYMDHFAKRLRWKSMDFEIRITGIDVALLDINRDGHVYSFLATHGIVLDVISESTSIGFVFCECELFCGGDTRGIVIYDSEWRTITRTDGNS